MKKRMIRISLFTRIEPYAKLKAIADRRDRGVGEMMREMLERWVSEQRMPPKRRTKRAAKTARKGGGKRR